MGEHGVFEVEKAGSYLRINARHGRLTMFGGVQRKSRGKKPICRVCGKPVMAGESVVFIHPIGEMGKDFHAGCAKLLGAAMCEVAKAAIAKAEGEASCR